MTIMTSAEKLKTAGLRPTRQRLALIDLLFAKGERHVTAEDLLVEAHTAKVHVSLATVYNALNQFTAAGMLREVAIEGHKTYFDTNVSNHYHFYLENEAQLVDIPDGSLTVGGIPPAPNGKRISRIDVIVRLEADEA